MTTAGAARCWGWNANGQIGNGDTTNQLRPVTVTTLSSGVNAISAGHFHGCALTTTGAARCWGSNIGGQLGDGTTTQRLTPVAVSGLGSGVMVIGAGHVHSCALTIAGKVECWGRNFSGQLGNNTLTDSLVPTSVLAPVPVIADRLFQAGFDS